MTCHQASLASLADVASAHGQHGVKALQNRAVSPAVRREQKRIEIANNLWALFGGPGKTQQAVAKEGERQLGRSRRQIIYYLKKESDAPAWFDELVKEKLIAKVERLARRIEGGS